MIKKLANISIEKLIYICMMVLLIGIPAIMLYNYSFDFNKIFKINRVCLLWLEVPFLFILYVIDLVFNKKGITYVDILIYLLILLGALSTIFAIDIHKSIFGEYTRNEGLLSLLSYYLIFLNIKNMHSEKYKNIIIKTLIFIGIINVIYGVLQVYTNWSFIKHFPINYMSSGLCGNANFFGSYIVILASFTFSMYIFEQKKKYLFLSIIFFMGLCLGSSTGPFISFLLVIVFFVIFYRKKIKWKFLGKILILFVLIYFVVDYSVKYVHINIYNNIIDSNYNISLELKNLNLSNVGNGRIKLWKESLHFIKEYWIVGAGLDNFGNIFGYMDGVYFDKAHNVYLQIAITNGIFALILYLILMLIIFFKGLKIKNKIYISIFMAFIGYSIQAFSNISVIEVAPSFFIICGLLLGKIQSDKIEKYNE